MKETIIILCIEDESDVLDAIVRDLSGFEPPFKIESAASADEAGEIIDGLDKERVALIFCDHVMPGQNGVDFLISLTERTPAALQGAQKVLFTGQAGHEETIEAINRAGIRHYLAKPWQVETLHELTRKLLTDYILEQEVDPLPYMRALDQKRITEAIHQRNTLNETGA